MLEGNHTQLHVAVPSASASYAFGSNLLVVNVRSGAFKGIPTSVTLVLSVTTRQVMAGSECRMPRKKLDMAGAAGSAQSQAGCRHRAHKASPRSHTRVAVLMVANGPEHANEQMSRLRCKTAVWHPPLGYMRSWSVCTEAHKPPYPCTMSRK